MVRMLRMVETGGLVHIDELMKITMEKGVGDI